MEGRARRSHAAILAIGSALSLVLSACGAPGLYVPGPEDTAGSPGPGVPGDGDASSTQTAWGRAVAGIHRDGTVPLDTALAAFSVAFGPLPGIEDAEGDPAVIGSASGPTRWILNHWDELTPEQQSAVDRYLAVDGPASIRTDPVAALNPLTAAVLDQSGFQRLAEEMAGKVGDKLGRSLGVPIDVVLRDLPGRDKDEIIYANTIPLDAAGEHAVRATPRMARCQVQVGKAAQVLPDVADQDAILAHEVFHCFQYALAKKLGDAMAMPAWLAEGAGAWVGEEIAGGSGIGGKYWLGWLSSPILGLFTREYSAIGFYAHLKTSGVDVWSRLDKMQLAAVGKSADAYAIAVDGSAGEAAINAWGPSYISDQRVGGEWSMFGPGMPSDSIAFFLRATLEDLDQYVVFEDPLTAYPLRLKTTAEVFVVRAFAPVRGLMWDASNGTKKLADVAGTPFCLKAGGCACPDGSPGSDHAFGTLTAGEEFYVGFSGHTGGINADLLTFSLEQTCDHSPEDFAPPPDCHCPPGPLGLAEPRSARGWS